MALGRCSPVGRPPIPNAVVAALSRVAGPTGSCRFGAVRRRGIRLVHLVVCFWWLVLLGLSVPRLVWSVCLVPSQFISGHCFHTTFQSTRLHDTSRRKLAVLALRWLLTPCSGLQASSTAASYTCVLEVMPRLIGGHRLLPGTENRRGEPPRTLCGRGRLQQRRKLAHG